MSASLRVEIIAVLVLGIVMALLAARLLWRWRTPRKKPIVTFLLVAGLFAGLMVHTTARIENYCSQAEPHVDCVSDRYDGPLWRVFRPMRRVYGRIRRVLVRLGD